MSNSKRSFQQQTYPQQLDSQEFLQLQGKYNRYKQQTELNQIVIAFNFYEVIQKQRTTIQRLQNQLADAKVASIQNQYGSQLKNGLSQLTLKISKSHKLEVEGLTKQINRLKQMLEEQKRKRVIPKFQINIASQQQLKKDIDIKIISGLENTSYIQKIKALTKQNEKISASLSQEKSKINSLKRQYNETIKNLSNSSNNQLQIEQLKTDFQKLTSQNDKLQNKLKSQTKNVLDKKQSYKKLITFVKQLFITVKLSQFQEIKLKDIWIKLANCASEIKEQISEKSKGLIASLLKQFVDSSNNILKHNVQDNIYLQQQLNAQAVDKSSLEAIKEQLQKEKSSLEAKNAQLIKQLASLREEKKKQKESFQKIISQNTIKIKTLLTNIEAKQKQIIKNKNEAQNKIKKMDQDNVQRLKLVKAGYQQQIRKLRAEIEDKNNVIEQFGKKNKQLQMKIKQLQNGADIQRKDIRDLQNTNSRKEDKIKQLENDITKLNNINNTNNNQIKNMAQIKDKLQNEINNLNKKLSQARQNLQQSLQIPHKINKKLVGISSQIFLGQERLLSSLIPERSKQLDKEIQQILILWRNQFNKSKFFNGSQVIPSQSVTWVVDTIQAYVKQIAYQTKLIYRYDHLNTVNFHQYIDKIPNLLVLVKITNGPIIGGFTVYQFDRERTQRPGKGFIFNLDYKKAYYVRNQPRLPVTSYDDYYMILGNAEIRIRCQQGKVFSNFGIANSTFDNGTDLRTKFLNVKSMMNNELDVDTYEFYEVKFRA